MKPSHTMNNFSVIKSRGAMVRPSREMPPGILHLSMIDQLPALRRKVQTLHVFRRGEDNVADVIKLGLSKALVNYYPLAGRLVESGQGCVQVECSGEGVWFVEASADCSLDAVGYLDGHPTPSYFQLLPDAPQEKDGFQVDPLVLMQVTRFSCNGYVIGLEFSHCICDGLGAAQFLNAVAELAKGLEQPTIEPIWGREVLTAPKTVVQATLNPPPPPPPIPTYRLEQATIDVSLEQVAQLKHGFYNLTGQTCSTFEAITAYIWQCRTQAIKLATDMDTTLVFFANARPLVNPTLPKGFYGNCFFPVNITASSGRILSGSIADIVKLIQEAKAKVPVEFSKWVAGDNMGSGKDPFAPPLSYTTLFVSEWARLGFGTVDYSWGPPMHIMPIQYSNIIPGCILCSPPEPKKGIRLMTWCVEETHRAELCDMLRKLT